LSYQTVRPKKSVTQSRCNAKLMVTFSATQCHRLLSCTKLHCLVTEAQRCKQLAWVARQPCPHWEWNLRPFDCMSDAQPNGTHVMFGKVNIEASFNNHRKIHECDIALSW